MVLGNGGAPSPVAPCPAAPEQKRPSRKGGTLDLSQYLKALEAFKAHDPFMSAQLMEVFITVCLNEGQPAQALELQLAIPKSTLSRHLGHLGPRYRRGAQGLQLIRLEENPADRRSKLVYLTDRGQALREALIRA